MGQSSSLKIKLAVLKYLQDLLCVMEPSDMNTSDDLRYAVGKIVSYTAEPKSVDVRKTAQAVLLGLYNLNSTEFSLLLNDLPKNIQENTHRILKTHIKNCNQDNNASVSSPSIQAANSSFTDYKYNF